MEDRRPGTDALAPHNHSNGGAIPPRETYCGYCGTVLDPAGIAARRFGEAFCGEAHADAFVAEARVSRVEAAARALRTPGEGDASAEPRSEGSVSKGWDVTRALKMAVCCGAPLLALVFLAGGGAALLGAASVILPGLALLACPIGMYFMMRTMQQHGKDRGNGGKNDTSPE